MKPHFAAEFWEPDAIAECLDVSPETYRELWSVVSGEVPGENDDSPNEWRMSHSVLRVWSRLSETAQQEINQALERNER